MPNLTFYIAEDQFGQISDVSDLTQRCRSLCVNHLGAAVENVHIIYIAVQSGCGHPIYAELIYRLSDTRSAEVMTTFMQRLDEIIQQATGLTPRIRCFGSKPEQLYAYH